MIRSLFFLFLSLLLSGCIGGEADSKIPNGAPSKPTVTKLRGHKYHVDSVIKGRDEFVWAQQVFSGYRKASDKIIPEEIST